MATVGAVKRCACGCGQPVEGRRPAARYARPACRSRASKRRVAAVAFARAGTPHQDWATDPAVRLKPAANRVLNALRGAGQRGLTTAELCQPEVGGCRFGARVHEIRNAGFVVVNRRIRNGSDRYWLTKEPGQLVAVQPLLPARAAA